MSDLAIGLWSASWSWGINRHSTWSYLTCFEGQQLLGAVLHLLNEPGELPQQIKKFGICISFTLGFLSCCEALWKIMPNCVIWSWVLFLFLFIIFMVLQHKIRSSVPPYDGPIWFEKQTFTLCKTLLLIVLKLQSHADSQTKAGSTPKMRFYL